MTAGAGAAVFLAAVERCARRSARFLLLQQAFVTTLIVVLAIPAMLALSFAPMLPFMPLLALAAAVEGETHAALVHLAVIGLAGAAFLAGVGLLTWQEHLDRRRSADPEAQARGSRERSGGTVI
jgi:hypothetical protein